jgi:Cu/Ag efflux pump CusA
MIDSFRFSTCIYISNLDHRSSQVLGVMVPICLLLFFFLTFLCVSSCNLRLTTFFPLEGF